MNGFLEPAGADVSPPPDAAGPMTELRGLQTISHAINQAADLEAVAEDALRSLDEALGFEHSMLFLSEGGGLLRAVKSHGYSASSAGAVVLLGQGLIGKAAEERRVLRSVGMDADLRYARAVRDRATSLGHQGGKEVPLPGIPDAQSQMALPLLVGMKVIGVLAVESCHPLRFELWHETFLELIGNQLALALDRFSDSSLAGFGEGRDAEEHGKLKLTFYAKDECVLLGDEYLVRGVPARILWKLLRESLAEGRSEFSNRELRLDSALGLPAIKDNLESRLLLLRRRLEEKCPSIRIVPVRRGRFQLVVELPIELLEKS